MHRRDGEAGPGRTLLDNGNVLLGGTHLYKRVSTPTSALPKLGTVEGSHTLAVVAPGVRWLRK